MSRRINYSLTQHIGNKYYIRIDQDMYMVDLKHIIIQSTYYNKELLSQTTRYITICKMKIDTFLYIFVFTLLFCPSFFFCIKAQ